MNKKILIGSILAVVLLTLVSFSSVVGYSSVKSNPSNTIITDEYDNATPIQLVFQLMTKLRNHKDIESVETEDDVIRIIEEDEELNSIYEQLSVEDDDCGCEDDSSTLEWRFPVLCTFLYPLWIIAGGILLIFHIFQFMEFMNAIGNNLDCWWA